ncbi:MAG: cysteine desulfurase family protein, partial [Roseimicrobium sp.]
MLHSPMIYLDANATTSVDPRVLDAMLPFLREHYANPSAAYAGGRAVRRAVETARGQVAALIDCEPEEIIFTSSGTESCNAALFSALTLQSHKQHLVVVKTEHSAVLEVAKRWVQEGMPVSFLDVEQDGRANVAELRGCARAGQTALVSMMWANNETGVLGPMEDAVSAAHEHGALFHTDAVQAAGKVAISTKKLAVDYLSLSGHKFHAPKGIGALFISKRVRFKPWMLGGGQERGRRSGTENVASIVGMGLAAELMREALERDAGASVRAMRDAFESHLFAHLPGTLRNGHPTHRLP